MGGATVSVKKDSLKELVDAIVEQIIKGINMGLFVDSDIVIVDEAGKETVFEAIVDGSYEEGIKKIALYPRQFKHPKNMLANLAVEEIVKLYHGDSKGKLEARFHMHS